MHNFLKFSNCNLRNLNCTYKIKNNPVQLIINTSLTETRRHTSSESTTRPASKPSNENHYDFLVSGGGMVGFAMACSLGRSSRLANQKILLLERAPPKSWSLQPEYSNRVCALSEHTKNLFCKLGVWDHITSLRSQPVKKMQVWESCSEAMITFNKDEVGDTIAHIVENDVILEAIKKQIPDNVQVMYSSTVDSYKLPSDGDSKVEVTLTTGDKITTDLLIGADGVQSLVRKTMGSKYVNWEYDQMGIVATLQLAEETENSIAWQRFLPMGPIAFLPLNKTHSSLVWSTTKQQAHALKSMTDEDFVDAINRAVWNDQGINKTVRDVHQKWLGILDAIVPGGARVKQLPPSIAEVVPGSRAAFPLGLGHAVHYVAERVALVGDAAHRVHPLAGQGVNLGFGDVNCLTQILEQAILLGLDVGDERQLHKYESERQCHNVSVMGMIDTLYRLYSTTSTPLVLLRSLGLSTIDALTPIKRQMIAHADR